MKDFIIQRVESNPSGYSAGCYFKNIEWNRKDVNKEQLLQKFPELQKFSDKPKIAVGFLIEFLGFKGKKIGGAEVAHKHAGFIVNNGQATTEDVLNLAASIKEKISEHYGFNLEEEVTVV